MPVKPHDQATWPADTIVVRCGSAQGVQEVADRLSRDGVWSVFTGPGVPFAELARSCRDNQVRRTTVEEILKAGGSLQPSSGPPHHHDLSDLTPQQFDAILGYRSLTPCQNRIGGSHLDYAPSRLHARAHVVAGNTLNARAEYQAVLTRWKDADADFALLKEAPAEAR